jgi:hypothetical protein
VHTRVKSVTRTVFHAPMFALKAVAELNACEPTTRRSTAVRITCALGVDAGAPTHEHRCARTRLHGRTPGIVSTRTRVRWYAWVRHRHTPSCMHSTEDVCIDVTIYRSLYIGHMGGERGTLARTRARVQLVPSHMRAYAVAGVCTGDPHMPREIFIPYTGMMCS